jgi:hypothetical protein
MGVYRISRNIEASLVDFITAELTTDGWSGIGVLKGFPQDYKGKAPFIGVEVLNLEPVKLEIGSKTHIKNYTVKIRIFAKNDGQRLDLADWLFDELENDVTYYAYTIANGVVSVKTATGKIVISKWNNNEKELQNTSDLEQEDKYRHLFSFDVNVAL